MMILGRAWGAGLMTDAIQGSLKLEIARLSGAF